MKNKPSTNGMYIKYQLLVQDLDENVDENLAWLTQKTGDPKM